MAKYLVTGGAGFIGSNTVGELLELGHEVRILDNFSTGKRENISDFLDKIDLFEGDIGDMNLVKKSVDGVDYVLHLAALPSVPRSLDDPVSTNRVNVSGTLNLLKASKDAGVKRFVFSSSSSVYGNSPGLPRKEEMIPNPLSPYAVSKLAAEYYCKVFYSIFNLEVVVLRYFNVFGPKQDPTSQYSAAIPKFISAISQGKSPKIFGDGEQSRDFTYVANVVHANILASQAKDIGGQIFNVACDGQITVNRVVTGLNKIFKTDIKSVYVDSRAGDVRHSFADSGKAREKIGYTPIAKFEDGLKNTVSWFMKSAIGGG